MTHILKCVKVWVKCRPTPWREDNTHLVNKEISQLLWNLKVHYHVHNSPSSDPILNQMNPVHILTTYLPKLHLNIKVSSMSRSSKWSLPFRLSDPKFVCISHLLHVCYMHWPYQLDLITLINTSWSVKWEMLMTTKLQYCN